MSKKLKILILIAGIFFVVDIVALLLIYYSARREPSVEIIPRITSNERINKIIFNHTGPLREAFGPSVLNENSLINLVHIVKKWPDCEISCEFGPAYQTANLDKFYPEEKVSMGQIRSCNIEIAEIIDEAVRSPEKDCRVPLNSSDMFVWQPLSGDYYLITLVIKEQEVTQEWVDRTQERKCFKPLKNLIGETIAIEFITGIIDLNENEFFY